jgi:Na+-translocating ferredoxin:NAD+ oxidoreductase subunit G
MAEEIVKITEIKETQTKQTTRTLPFDKESIPILLVVLTLTCAIGTFGLAITFNVTKDIIQKTLENERTETIRKVLPPFKGSFTEKTVQIDGQDLVFFVAEENGKAIGVATVASEAGYGGPIEVMIGILPDNAIYGVQLMRHQETPGLGAKANNNDFKSQFKGKKMNSSSEMLTVVKAGKKAPVQDLAINAITAATITSAAFTKAVNKALLAFMANKQKLLGSS